MTKPAPFLFILAAQSLGAFSEAFGQRASRRMHHGSHLRLLVSMSIYCCIQAFVVLAIAQYAFPDATGGQGSISMWASIVHHPQLLFNAVNNSVYWLAMAFSFGEPLGAILIVLAFLFASFLVTPFQELFGLPAESTLTAGPVVIGSIGALLCVMEIPLPYARLAFDRAVLPCLAFFCGGRDSATVAQCARFGSYGLSGQARRPQVELAGGQASDQPGAIKQTKKHGRNSDESSPLLLSSAASSPMQVVAAATFGASQEAAAEEPTSFALSASPSPSPSAPTREQSDNESFQGATTAGSFSTTATNGRGANVSAAACCCLDVIIRLLGPWAHDAGVLLAFCVVALTTATGITLTTYMQKEAGLSSAGYTAVDQVLLPLTTLPMVALLNRSVFCRRLVGEPPWSSPSSPSANDGDDSVTAPSLWAILTRTWAEVKAKPAPVPAEEEDDVDKSASADKGGDEENNGNQEDDEDAQSVLPKSPGLAPRPNEKPKRNSRPSACTCLLSLFRRMFGYELPNLYGTLIPFHGLEFVRTFVFFTLVTAYDVDSTYLTMTLVRIVLVFLVSVMVTTVLRRWVGISKRETEVTLHPVNLVTRGLGAVVLVVAILALKGIV